MASESNLSYGISMSDHDIVALQSIVGEFDSRVCVEIGSWVGKSAMGMIRGGADRVYCVDTWEGSDGDPSLDRVQEYGSDAVWGEFVANTRELLFREIMPVRGKSVDVAAIWPFCVDLVMIDADHSYESVVQDIDAWLLHVKPGGIICGHDENFDSVRRALRYTLGTWEVRQQMWFRRL